MRTQVLVGSLIICLGLSACSVGEEVANTPDALASGPSGSGSPTPGSDQSKYPINLDLATGSWPGHEVFSSPDVAIQALFSDSVCELVDPDLIVNQYLDAGTTVNSIKVDSYLGKGILGCAVSFANAGGWVASVTVLGDNDWSADTFGEQIETIEGRSCYRVSYLPINGTNPDLSYGLTCGLGDERGITLILRQLIPTEFQYDGALLGSTLRIMYGVLKRIDGTETDIQQYSYDE